MIRRAKALRPLRLICVTTFSSICAPFCDPEESNATVTPRWLESMGDSVHMPAFVADRPREIPILDPAERGRARAADSVLHRPRTLPELMGEL
jgi:hypothetical protein